MGLRDAEEMLEAAKADAILMERQIATLTEQGARMAHRLAAVRRVIATKAETLQSLGGSYDVVEVWHLEEVLDAPDDEESSDR